MGKFGFNEFYNYRKFISRKGLAVSKGEEVISKNRALYDGINRELSKGLRGYIIYFITGLKGLNKAGLMVLFPYKGLVDEAIKAIGRGDLEQSDRMLNPLREVLNNAN